MSEKPKRREQTYDSKGASGCISFFPPSATGKKGMEVLRLTPAPEYEAVLYPTTPYATPIKAVIDNALRLLRQGDTIQAQLLLRETSVALEQVRDTILSCLHTSVVPESALSRLPGPRSVRVDLPPGSGDRVDSVIVNHEGDDAFTVCVQGATIRNFRVPLRLEEGRSITIVPVILDDTVHE